MHEQGARELTGRRRELLEILPDLRRFALSLTAHAGAGDELLHATVARVLQRGSSIEAELLPWCIRVCRDLWLEASNGHELRRTAGSDCTPSTRTAPRADDVRSDDTRELAVALSELSGEQRAVLELVAVEGHSYSATAAMLDMPIGRVMDRLARARGALIEHYLAGWRRRRARRGFVTDAQQELDDEILSACHDGELPPSEAEAVRRRLAREPELGVRLDAMQHVDAAAAGAFRARDRHPFPGGILELLATAEEERQQRLRTGNVVRMREPNSGTRTRRRWTAVMLNGVASALRRFRAHFPGASQ